jgi:hypothetical protein
MASHPAAEGRLKSLELDGEPTMSQSTFVNGLKTLPVRFELA